MDTDYAMGDKALELTSTKTVGKGQRMKVFMNHIKSQQDLENTFYSKTHTGCIVLLGILFGLTSFAALFQEVKEIGLPIPFLLMVFIIVGILTIYAYFISFLGVLWAMTKLFKGGRNKFRGYIKVSANALPPLWIALPIINFYFIERVNGGMAFFLLILSGICLIVFLGRMVSVTSIWFGMTKINTSLSFLTTLIFFGSFLYLQFG
jgi:hypothetical protein